MNKKSEIVFLYPLSTGEFIYHLGANYIIAYLKSKGIVAKQFVTQNRQFINELEKNVLKYKPSFIGFTCFEANYPLIQFLTVYIKRRYPKINILLGGPTPTFSDEFIMRVNPAIDICVRREGELSVFEVIKNFTNGGKLADVAGITYRENSRLKRNDERPLIGISENKNLSLDDLPSPYLSGVLDIEDQLRINGNISVLTSRGCPYHCTFCNFSAMSDHKVRFYSPQRVFNEFKFIHSYKSKLGNFYVNVYDDTFGIDKRRVDKLCNLILKNNIRLNLVIATRAGQLKQKILKTLSQIGVKEVQFGLESSIPSILYKIKKVRKFYGKKNNYQPEKLFLQNLNKDIQCVKDLKMKAAVSVIFGLPGERLKDAEKTLAFLKKLNVGEYAHNVLRLYPGTEMYKKNKNYRPLYDVSRLPLLTNIALHSDEKKQALESRLFINSMMGFYNQNNDASVVIEDIILNSKNSKFINILKNKMQFEKHYIYIMKLSYLLNFNHLRKKTSYIDICFINGKEKIGGEKSMPEINFRKKVFYRHCRNFDAKEENALIALDSKADINKFISIFKRKGNIFLRQYSFCFILDACRWLEYCPAVNLKRLIIDKRGWVSTCFRGKPVGNIYTDSKIGYYKDSMVELRKKEELKRGCLNCSVKDHCSKCIFLGGINFKDYCKWRKAGLITTYLNSLRVARKIDYS